MPGTGGDDIINGGPADETLRGFSGTDRISGNAGDDILLGGDGADDLRGGDGSDTLYGHGLGDIASESGVISAVRVAQGLANPVYAVSPPGDPDRLFLVEKDTGAIRILDLATGALSADPFLDIAAGRLSTGGERGLLGLAFHPDYATNGRFFVKLTNENGDGEVLEYRRSAGDPDIADPAGNVILTYDQPFSNHNGGWLGFGPDGYLYISNGDGGSSGDPGNNAQNVNSLLGKMLRIDVNSDAFPGDPARDYAIPAGNPFAGSAGADEIWAFGLRNPWRASFDRLTGDFYIGDVGQGSFEEIDFQPTGASGAANYGWSVLEGNMVFDAGDPGNPAPGDPSLVAPVHVYGRGDGQSVTGGYVHRGPDPGLQGTYFFGDFVSGRIWSFNVHDGEAVDFIERTGQIAADAGTVDLISSFAEDGRGNLYVIGLDGDIHRLDLPENAGDADDRLDGGAGNDSLFGGRGADTLIGGTGADTLDGGTNPADRGDLLLGGAGDDAYLVDHALDLVDEGNLPEFAGLGFGGVDSIVSTAAFYWDVYSIGERLVIAADADDPDAAGTTAVGSVFSNEMVGNAGANILFGRGGSDVYRAGDGVDYISLSPLSVQDAPGYTANGANTIVVEQRATGAFSYDIVFEFEAGRDRVDVSDYGFSTASDVLARGVDDGFGNSYFILGDGLDYLYMVGLGVSAFSAADFIV